ncbi:DUF6311 domain-containing protein [Candidatus Pelagibacter sp.]|nr:DUF6311 domain-containing protein [Candidatus Pelagibacter sp.]
MKKYSTFKYQIFLIITSISFCFYLLGPNYISPLNSEWLFSGDLSTYQLGWQFFKLDEWRFPLGINPNYGIYLNSSVVFSDSIPLVAIFFKIFKNFLPSEFQYFSIWILVCVYLQLYFSFKIIYKITNNLLYSAISSLFFVIATVFIHRSGIHLSLFGQWIILSFFYVELLDKNKFYYKNLIILLSTTIHFYFTIILLIIFFIEKVIDYFRNKKLIKNILIQTSIVLFASLFLMYIIGYFSLNLDDGLGWGYGYYNFNLNSFFNPVGQTNISEVIWSNFLAKREFQNGQIEGFSYLGLSGFIFLIIFLFNMFNKRNNIIYSNIKIFTICVIFLILSTSNNIYFDQTSIIKIPLNNFFYAIASIIRASGRLIWPIYYLIFIVGIIFIYQNFQKKISSLIILILLLVQIADISKGLNQYKLGKQYDQKNNQIFIKDKIWKDLSRNYEQIRLLEPQNQSKIYHLLSKTLFKEKFLKTDIVYLARANRQKTIDMKYKIVNLLDIGDLDLFHKTVFISDNVNAVRHVFHIYQNKLNYYFRDDLWIITKKNINYNEVDNSNNLNDVYTHNFENNDSVNFNNFKIAGIGWDRKNLSDGLILEGYKSSLFLKIYGKNCSEESLLKIKINQYYSQNPYPINLKVFINKQFIKQILIDKKENDLLFKFNCLNGKKNSFYFHVENPISLFDKKNSLNRVKRSIILKNLSIIN